MLSIASLSGLFNTTDVYADYNVSAGQKCDDGSEPQITRNPPVTTYTCADSTKTNGGAGQQTGGKDIDDTAGSDEGTTCAVEKIGWIICPVIEGTAKMADLAFTFLANNFLAIEPELLTSEPKTGEGTITAWNQARNIANIMFVIAFIVIIYSQITGSGLNNYGIKRMLPRLILAAIAVNTSYYICQALVDLSNILGYNIMDALQEIAKKIGPQVLGADTTGGVNTHTTSTGGVLATIAIGLLASAAVVWLLLPVLGSIVLFILVTCITVIIILLLRKAMVVLLVVISPLAFVMYLLPNTEKYFSKWLSMFWKLLLVFPIVALLLGAGQLTSTIILVSDAQRNGTAAKCDTAAPNNTQTPQTNTTANKSPYRSDGECAITLTNNGKTSQAGWTLGLVAAGIAVAPLLAVWAVLQGALSAAGAIGGKIGGAINSVQSKQRGKLGKSMGEGMEYRRNQMNAAALRGGGLGTGINVASFGSARRAAKRRAKNNYAKSALHTEETDYIASKAVDDSNNITPFGRSLAGGMLASDQQRDRVRANAINARNTLEAEEVKAAHAIVDRLDPRDGDGPLGSGGQAGAQVQALINGGQFDSPHLAALLEQLAKSNREAFMQYSTAVLNATNGRETGASRAIGSAMSGISLYSGGDAAQATRGVKMDLRKTAIEGIEKGGLSPAEIAGAPSDEINVIDRIANESPAARAQLRGAAGRMTTEQQNKISQANATKISRW